MGTWGNRNKEMCPNLSDYRPGALGEEHSVFSTVCLINLLHLPVCKWADGAHVCEDTAFVLQICC